MLTASLVPPPFFVDKLLKALDDKCLKTSLTWSHCVSPQVFGDMGDGQKNFSQLIFVLQKVVVRFIADLKAGSQCREPFRNVNIVKLPRLYIFEILLYATLKDNQPFVSTHNTKFKTRFAVAPEAIV